MVTHAPSPSGSAVLRPGDEARLRALRPVVRADVSIVASFRGLGKSRTQRRYDGKSTAQSGASAPAGLDPDEPRQGGVGVRLVDVPVARADDPRARVYVIDHVKPGDVIVRRVEVSNGTSSSAQISVYPAAAFIERGSFIGAEGHTQNELSTWTSVKPTAPVLESRSTALVDVTIKVPSNAPSGEQYGVVWAEMTTQPAGGVGVTQVSRAGVRLYISVGPGGEPASDFQVRSLTPARGRNGTPFVEATVRNTGGRALDLRGTLRLTEGPGGLSAGPFEVTLGPTLGVDQTELVTVPLDKALPDGPWTARITLESGLLERSAQARITFPAAGIGEPVEAEQAGGFPWLRVVGGVVLLVMLALLRACLFRRRGAVSREGTHRPKAAQSV